MTPCPGYKRPCGVLTPQPLCRFCQKTKDERLPIGSAPGATARDAIAALPIAGEKLGWDFIKRTVVLRILDDAIVRESK